MSLMYYQEKNKSMSFLTWQGVTCKYCSCYVNSFSSPGDLPNPGIGARCPALQADLIASEPPKKPKNTGVVAYPFFRGSCGPRIEPGSTALQVDFLPVELPGKPISIFKASLFLRSPDDSLSHILTLSLNFSC